MSSGVQFCQVVVLIWSTYLQIFSRQLSGYSRWRAWIAAGPENFKRFKNVKLSCQAFNPANDHANYSVSEGERQKIHQSPHLLLFFFAQPWGGGYQEYI